MVAALLGVVRTWQNRNGNRRLMNGRRKKKQNCKFRVEKNKQQKGKEKRKEDKKSKNVNKWKTM